MEIRAVVIHRIYDLSSTIYEDIMQLMVNKIIHTIVDQIKKCKYFSLIIDSTPDITHIDQLSFIVRYVYEGIPVERFIQCIPSCRHKANDMKKAVLDTLESLDISISDCRGQAYDTANNMSGRYNGLQAKKKKELNPLGVYIPCAAHSLNLVGTHAVQCSNEAAQFFLHVQHLYTFFFRIYSQMEHFNVKFKV